MTKFIFVTGGVVSSIGKGIATASLGRLLRSRGFQVTLQKLDPYINVDAGTMSPYQHGEVFVTKDGAETDLDLGHYERFVDVELTRRSSVTTGSVYQTVIENEREGKYLGATVQLVPHITNEIKSKIRDAAKGFGDQPDADVLIAEVGGTVGDLESLPFLEAIRQFKKDIGQENVMYIHVTLIPSVGPWSEIKTKPTQHSVIKLREMGIQPDVLVCRTRYPLSPDMRNKLSLFCDVMPQAVIESRDAESIYEIPLMYEQAGIANLVAERLNLPQREPDLSDWENIVSRLKKPKYETNVAIVGKYTENGDAYLSIQEALIHAGIANETRVNICWTDSDLVLQNPDMLESMDAILVGPGFGGRGVEGKITAAQWARVNRVPYLGVCYGMQMAVIAFARNVLNMENANTEEVAENTQYPVIHILPEQKAISNKGGTMRLGDHECRIKSGTLAERLYQSSCIVERHRHRYELNNDYREALERAGMQCSGLSPDYRLVEIIELTDHPFYIATQFHPEFRSRPNRAHPLFNGFIAAAVKRTPHLCTNEKNPEPSAVSALGRMQTRADSAIHTPDIEA